MKKILFMLLLTLTFYGCTQQNVIIQKSIPVEIGPPIKTYFCPRDNCSAQLINLIEKSSRVDCAFYDLNIPKLIDALENANARIIVDNRNTEDIQTLNYKTDKSSALMHNKFCILDEVVWTGSFNPTINGDTKNNNNVIVIDSPTLAMNYREEFSEMWSDNWYNGGRQVRTKTIKYNNATIVNLFCPEDDCTPTIYQLLKNAKHSIYWMIFSFTDDSIGSLIYYKNVTKKGVFDSQQAGSQYSEYQKLKEFSIKDTNKGLMHHKVFIIDEKTIVTGSYNPTKNANERNDENILIIHDTNIVKEYLEEFNTLFS
ncbi:hypothetical protein GOV04_03595 [Candidatus Woesearchaeota archaeon]|nr:hypothetical protein [Candidatus Woesearchaeota archaeon]